MKGLVCQDPMNINCTPQMRVRASTYEFSEDTNQDIAQTKTLILGL